MLVDHDNKRFERATAGKDDQGKIEDRVNFLMNMPVRVATPLVDKVTFSAKKSGLLGTAACVPPSQLHQPPQLTHAPTTPPRAFPRFPRFPVSIAWRVGFGSSKLEKVGEYEAEIYTLSNFKIRTYSRYAPARATAAATPLNVRPSPCVRCPCAPHRPRSEHLDPKLVPSSASTSASPSKDALAGPSASASASIAQLSLSGSKGSLSTEASAQGSVADAAPEEPSKDVLGDLLDAPMDADSEDAQANVLAKLEGKGDTDVEAFYKNARAKAMRFRPSLTPPPAPPVDFQTYFLPELAQGTSPIPRSATPTPAVAPSGSVGSSAEPQYIHVGRPVQQKEVTQNVKATLWMSTSFPLFVEQLFPLMTIMSPTNEHFARFKEFIDLKLPRGFPVKVGTKPSRTGSWRRKGAGKQPVRCGVSAKEWAVPMNTHRGAGAGAPPAALSAVPSRGRP